eukprot:7389248-Lingulodinium_polyedra.AAC.1
MEPTTAASTGAAGTAPSTGAVSAIAGATRAGVDAHAAVRASARRLHELDPGEGVRPPADVAGLPVDVAEPQVEVLVALALGARCVG